MHDPSYEKKQRVIDATMEITHARSCFTLFRVVSALEVG
jgi:hypothetical protein